MQSAVVNSNPLEEMNRQAAMKGAPPVQQKAPEEPDIEPPDKEVATEEEKATSERYVNLLRTAKENLEEQGQLDPVFDIYAEHRAEIEESLEPLNVNQLFTQGYVEQEIPLFDDGESTLILRSSSGSQQAIIDRWVRRAVELKFTPLTQGHLILTAMAAVSIVRLDGESPGPELPINVDPFQVDSEPLFKIVGERVRWLMNKPAVLADLVRMHNQWFSQRVRRVFGNQLYLRQSAKKS